MMDLDVLFDMLDLQGHEINPLQLIEDADAGVPKAQIVLGIMYYMGVGMIEEDRGKGVLYCIKGILQDPQNGKLAVDFIREVSENGDLSAQDFFHILLVLLAGATSNPTPYDAIINWAAPLAQQGSPVCQRILGELYAEGNGVEQDYWEAVKYLRKAAKHGDMPAQYTLGKLYLEGDGVKQDINEALNYLIPAALRGHAGAQTLMGNILAQGEKYEEAANFWSQAADQGESEAQYKLGLLYEAGLGVEEDHWEAVKWWRRAAENGFTDARNELAKRGIYE